MKGRRRMKKGRRMAIRCSQVLKIRKTRSRLRFRRAGEFEPCFRVVKSLRTESSCRVCCPTEQKGDQAV
jgi:hypothetical protein